MKKELIENILVRIHLKPNSSEIGGRENFMIYGILLFPMLIGYIIFYGVFELRAEALIYAFIVFVTILVNLFFFFKNSWRSHYRLCLILDGGYIQFLDAEKLITRIPLDEIRMEIQWCKKSNCPAVLLKHQNMPVILIGQKKGNEAIKNSSLQKEMCQPDYWLVRNDDWQKLVQGLTQRSKMVSAMTELVNE